MARLKLSWKNFLESRIQNLSSVLWNRETSKPKPRALHKKMLTRVQPLWGDFCISHASSTIKTGQQTGLATDRLLRIRFIQEISRHFYQWQVIFFSTVLGSPIDGRPLAWVSRAQRKKQCQFAHLVREPLHLASVSGFLGIQKKLLVCQMKAV